MAEETGHGGRVKSPKSKAMVVGYGKGPCHLKMKNTLWTKIHMSGVSDSLKKLKAIDPQMNIEMRNHKLLPQMPGELEHAVKCRCNQNCTLDDIANMSQEVSKRTNIGKYTPYKSSGFKEKQPFWVEFKDKPREWVAEVEKKKTLVENVIQQTTMATTVQSQRKKSVRLRKSQRRNPQQRILNQTLWGMPSENNLMMTKTQENNS
ncbi:hypothetical protein O181_087006 [Austropuccinia psidii MF-1]|uniref:Uncharacterized protein n=1 Tax=Austropuccinia psidii MF-1 TaxID=1389203 RepID=A0A9Q3INW2_9BASI|nr:hypothetical protein [Austropuccinia psidii MF-1]